MTAERRPDPFVAGLARILRRVAEREAAEAADRRAKMRVVQGGKRKEDAA